MAYESTGRAVLLQYLTLPPADRGALLSALMSERDSPRIEAMPMAFELLDPAAPDKVFMNMVRGMLHSVATTTAAGTGDMTSRPLLDYPEYDYKSAITPRDVIDVSSGDLLDSILTASNGLSYDDKVDACRRSNSPDGDITGDMSDGTGGLGSLAKLAGKGLLRSLPGVGLAMTAYDIAEGAYDMYKGAAKDVPVQAVAQKGKAAMSSSKKMLKRKGANKKPASSPMSKHSVAGSSYDTLRKELITRMGEDGYRSLMRKVMYKTIGEVANEPFGDLLQGDLTGSMWAKVVKIPLKSIAKKGWQNVNKFGATPVGGATLGAAAITGGTVAVTKMISDDPARAAEEAGIPVEGENAVLDANALGVPGAAQVTGTAVSNALDAVSSAAGVSSDINVDQAIFNPHISKDSDIIPLADTKMMRLYRLGQGIQTRWESAFSYVNPDLLTRRSGHVTTVPGSDGTGAGDIDGVGDESSAPQVCLPFKMAYTPEGVPVDVSNAVVRTCFDVMFGLPLRDISFVPQSLIRQYENERSLGTRSTPEFARQYIGALEKGEACYAVDKGVVTGRQVTNPTRFYRDMPTVITGDIDDAIRDGSITVDPAGDMMLTGFLPQLPQRAGRSNYKGLTKLKPQYFDAKGNPIPPKDWGRTGKYAGALAAGAGGGAAGVAGYDALNEQGTPDDANTASIDSGYIAPVSTLIDEKGDQTLSGVYISVPLSGDFTATSIPALVADDVDSPIMRVRIPYGTGFQDLPMTAGDIRTLGLSRYINV